MSQLWLVCVYTIFTTFYCLGLSMIGTLIRLFRGRKLNTIRGRVDSNSFNTAEMYLGIIVVSISLLLLPTLAFFYYYAFISIMLSVIGMQILLVFCQILFTDFPYFNLVFALWQPYLLPGGIQIDCTQQVKISAKKVAVGSCFEQIASEFSPLLQGNNQSLLKEIFGSVLKGKNLFTTMINYLSILNIKDHDTPATLGHSEFVREILVSILWV